LPRVHPSKDNSKVCVKAIDERKKLQELKEEVIMNGFPELVGSNIDIDFGDVKIPNSYASIHYILDFFGRLITNTHIIFLRELLTLLRKEEPRLPIIFEAFQALHPG